MDKKYFNLTNPQKSIWNMEQFFKGTGISNIPVTIIFNETIDEKCLIKAINEMIRKNVTILFKF